MPDLAEALGLSALLAGSLEYAILIRHRQERRMRLSFVDDAYAVARNALARVSQRDNRWPMRRWTADGTRFRIEGQWPRWPSRRG